MITPLFSLTATKRSLPNLALDFTTASLDSRIAFTRTTGASNPATFVNSSGYITLATENQPRFDYDPITLACKGLLIEESRANLLTHSEDFSNAVWTVTRTSVSVNQETAPDNALTGDKILEDSSTNTHFFTRSSFSFTSGTSYSLSIYLKAAGRSRIRITSGNTTTWSAGSTFNLANGTIAATSFGSSRIQAAGNGWYRCTITGTAGATASTVVNFVFSNGVSESYAGDGSSGVFAWGGQIEAGAFATSYIPTTTASLTRNADVASITGSNFSGWYNVGSGSVFAKALPSTVLGVRPVIQFDDNTADEIIALRGNTTNPELYIKDSTDQAQIDAGTIAANTAYLLAASWATNDCAASANGGAPVLDGNATIPTVTQARFGNDGTNYLNGHIQTVEYYKEKLLGSSVQIASSIAGYRSIITPLIRDTIIF